MKKCNTIKSFQECLVSVAQQCADGADIHIAWYDFLLTILKNWNADIQMDLHDTVVIMLSAAGLDVKSELRRICLSDKVGFNLTVIFFNR